MAVIAKIRKHAGLAVALIGIAIIGFVVQDAFGRRGRKIPPVVVVNGETVSYNQFSEQVEQLTEQYRRAQGEDLKITEEDMKQIRDMAWQRIVSEYLLQEACTKVGLNVTAAEMNDMYYGRFLHPYLYNYFVNPQTGVYDRQQVMNLIDNFDRLSDQDRNSLLDLERVIKRERLREKYYGLLSASFYMPKALAEVQLAERAEAYTARYVCCPYIGISDADVVPDKSDFRKFYNENRYMFRQNKSRSIDYVVFDVRPTPQDLADIDEQVAELYAEFQQEENIPDFVNAVSSGERFDSLYRNQSEVFPGWDTLFHSSAGTFFAPRRMNKTYQMAKLMDVQMRPDSMRVSHIFLSYSEAGSQSGRNKEQARRLADSLTALLNANPALFAQTAAQYSEDPSAAQNGGDLGWQRDGYFVSFLNRAILSTSAGKTTMVEGPNGFHILYVAEKTAPVKKVLAAVVTVPIEPGSATTKAVYTQANQLLGQCKGSIAGLDSAAARAGYQVRQASATETDIALPGLSSAREIVRWAYDDDTKEGRVADRIFEMENRYVVAALRSINETDYMTLEHAMRIPQVEYMVKQQKKFEALSATLGGATIEEVAQALDLNIDTVYGINLSATPMLGGSAYEPAVVGTICGSARGELSKVIKGNGGAYRVTVDNVVAGEVNPIEVELFRRQAQMQFMQTATNSIGAAMQDAAEIKDNRSFYF